LLGQFAFDLQAKYLKQLVEHVIRDRMGQSNPDEMLIDGVATSSRSVSRSRRSSTASTISMIGIAGSSNPSSSAYNSSYNEYNDRLRRRQSRKRRTRSKSVESINDTVSHSESDESDKDKKKRNTHAKRQNPRSPKERPNYLFTLDLDKDFLTALRVNIIFLLYYCIYSFINLLTDMD